MKDKLLARINNFDFNRTFIIDTLNSYKYTYSEFFGRVLSLTNKLREYDGNKRHVVLLMENSVELVSFYFATLFSGKIATAIDPLKGSDEIKEILSTINDGIIIVDRAGEKKCEYKDSLIEADFFHNTPCLSESKSKTLSLLRDRSFVDDYLLTYTSGTSGNTKGVRNSFANLIQTADAFNKVFNIGENNRFAHLLPMTYMAGILNTIIQPFIAGSQIVVMGRFNPIIAFSFWQLASSNNVNTFWLSPSMLTIIQKVGNENVGKQYASENNLLFFIGTAPLHLSTRQAFEDKYGVTLYASYGLSETLYLSVETPNSLSKGGNNVGELLEGVEYKFSDKGEFLVKVPWMYLGYTNEPTELYFEQGYYKTGDLAEIHDSILSIVGRAKDLIIKGGMNVSPALIEKVVSEIPTIEECAAFGVVNTLNEECIVLGYSTSSNVEIENLESEIYSMVAMKLGKNYLIDKFYRVKAIPKNINGKIDKKILKKNYLQYDN